MTLADRLAARALPQVVVPIAVGDPGEDLRRRAGDAVELAQLARLRLPSLDDEDAEAMVEALEADADALSAELAEHYEDVVLQRAVPDVWEAILAAHTVEDADGSFDLDGAALPVMLAACAVDESLQDPAWWAVQLQVWPLGDRQQLRAAALTVNAYRPLVGLGKG